MNNNQQYTEKEIKIIKQRAYDKGRIEGVIITLLVCGVALVYVLHNMK